MAKAAYRGRRWERTRRLVLERDGWRCQGCGRSGWLEVDHIRPLSRGGDHFDLGNLQALCKSCHSRKTARERRAPVPPEVAAWDRRLEELRES